MKMARALNLNATIFRICIIWRISLIAVWPKRLYLFNLFLACLAVLARILKI